MKQILLHSITVLLSAFILAVQPASAAESVALSDDQVADIVQRSYQYVAIYNVNNKFAITQGGWNTVVADTTLKDHTQTDIPRPNNDTLYIGCLLDLREDAMILDIPAFDSKYVSLMVTAYDHYVAVPMSTRLGDFAEPERVLFYSENTRSYGGEPVEGVDRTIKTTGDFVSAVFRVMPHFNEPDRSRKIMDAMQEVTLTSLSEFQGGEARPASDPGFPDIGATDLDTYENNLLEVMQFVFNHVEFDPNNPLDQAVLADYAQLGVVPGKEYDPSAVAQIDGARFRKAADEFRQYALAAMLDPEVTARINPLMFQPKGQTSLEAISILSVVGPLGIPVQEAAYPALSTADGQTMNALNDYVIRMSKDELPPATAFWSMTLYDTDNGFFIPNDRKKYSVGENAGMELNKDGGIEVHIAAEKPEGVPEANWLPINRKDQNLDIIMRIYVPDLEKLKTWKAPKIEKAS